MPGPMCACSGDSLPPDSKEGVCRAPGVRAYYRAGGKARLGTLYVVGTPIGNLEDISLRALRVLREVALVAAEDTRTARNLLRHYEIATPVTSFHDFTQVGKARRLAERIAGGEDVALISEAGMPGISDPGYALVAAALAERCEVTCVPGPSAVLTALVLSALPAHAFCFVGFLPRRAGERRRRIAELGATRETIVCFESPHRLLATLRDIVDTLGPDFQMAVGRELTKHFEEVVRGTAAEVLERFEQTPPRGELTLVLGGRRPDKPEKGARRGRAPVDPPPRTI